MNEATLPVEPWALTTALLASWDADPFTLVAAREAYRVATIEAARHWQGVPSIFEPVESYRVRHTRSLGA